ncbi:uncharacterized protein LOC135383928 isoform X2 [Ornithodoros turicata]|uniref:uncharacterized protein LOC135383928 isoform X2 n=1 Tax=Ornithodoros turicata TaxID=34597 RepID=UPI003138E4ED
MTQLYAGNVSSTRFVGFEQIHFTSEPLFAEEESPQDGNESPLLSETRSRNRRSPSFWEFKPNSYEAEKQTNKRTRWYANNIIVNSGLKKWNNVTRSWTFWQRLKYYPLIFFLLILIIALSIEYMTLFFCCILDHVCMTIGFPCRHQTFLRWAEEELEQHPTGKWLMEDGSVSRYEPTPDEMDAREELEYLMQTFPREREGWLEDIYNIVVN